MPKSVEKYEPLLLFDGECKLCHGLVQFILRHDKNHSFYFSPLQSDFSEDLLKEENLESEVPETVVLFAKGKTYTYSSAALQVMTILGGIWSLAGIFWVVPKPIRDWVYRKIAGNRYQWFGKYETCVMPDTEWKERIIGEI